MNTDTEINRGYVPFPAGDQVMSSPPRWESLRNAFAKVVLFFVRLPCLIFTSIVMVFWLKVYLRTKKPVASPLYDQAINHIAEFVTQYPLHLYPIVCKSFELAVLKDKLHSLLRDNSKLLEVAIGEGTLSQRIFPSSANVVGLDLIPYSLKKASQMAHVKQAIVCDCLQPPIQKGTFDFLIANNFLHHVTDKEATLAQWAGLAEKAIFNENTPYWGSGWSVPYVLRSLGLKNAAARRVYQINRHSLQSLEFKSQLDKSVAKHYEIVDAVSYMSERTFFYSSIFSFWMRCYGPPTPPNLKRLFLGPLRWIAIPMTTTLAQLLICFDQYQDRSRDVFVSYLCKSREYVPSDAKNHLICPTCQGKLDRSNQCEVCAMKYSITDGMLFLLRQELEHIQRDYQPEIAASRDAEHL